MKNKINLNLDKLAQGGVQELFDMNVKKILENIQDLNTEPKLKRKMTITIDFIPDETRSMITLGSQVKVGLAPTKGVATVVLTGRNNDGELEANELQSGVPGQTYIDMETGELMSDIGEKLSDEQAKPTVIDLQQSKKA
ncbi:replication terminator protein [Lactococcus allomyrinae]|uniref:Replication terminator protein n=1 Tax=Lactococcus allomyrinae TaxID=2419773 RepID=A0A387BHN4_9LACT|nr:replication terminator protein [Lactococcus allomyrinae]AYG01692.1 replication terminator protein [Lactococcus allomyrinae]